VRGVDCKGNGDVNVTVEEVVVADTVWFWRRGIDDEEMGGESFRRPTGAVRWSGVDG